MNRLTSRCKTGPLSVMVRGKALGPAYFMSKYEYEDYRDAIARLADYEDAEEDGRLVMSVRKLTPEAKHLIKTLPEAVNLLAQKVNDTLDKLLINGAKEDTPTGILAARADKERGADNGNC